MSQPVRADPDLGPGRIAVIVRSSKSLVTVLIIILLVAGCGGLGSLSGSGKNLTLGYIQWDENVAVSNLTKVLLEEELGYENVELKLIGVPGAFTNVASGEMDAFQDVWLPNHQAFLDGVISDVERLDPWYEGETSYGIAVPDYMTGVRSLADLNEAGTDKIIGIEPTAAFHPQIPTKVVPAYDLDVELVEASTPAMLAELKKSYDMMEPIVFLRWEPHWMNAVYDLRYLEDPKDAQGEFNDPAKISSIVNEDLSKREPVAYRFLNAISLDANQVNQMELDINKAGDPARGIQTWLKSNREVVDPWIESARKSSGS